MQTYMLRGHRNTRLTSRMYTVQLELCSRSENEYGLIDDVTITENGFQLVLWVGQQVSHDFISQVFGVPSPAQINTDMVSHCLLQCLV